MRIVAASVAVLVVGALPAGAAPHRPLVIADPAGDANFVNDGGEFESGNQPTATSEPSLDLRRVEVAPTRSGGTTTGFTVSMTTQGELRDRTQLTLKTRTQSCPDILLVYVHRAGGPAAVLSSGCSPERTPLVTQVEANGITVTVPFSSLPAKARGDRMLGTVNAYSQLHLASDPFQRQIGTTLVDTTLQDVSYRMR